MKWLNITRGTETTTRKGVWVSWSDATPFHDLLLVNGEPVTGNMDRLVAELEADPNIPEWFKDCNEVVFPPFGIIFLGPEEGT